MASRRSYAFTLVELLVVVAIIALLISIILPSLSRARELSKRTICLSNLRSLTQALYLYAQDGDLFPAYGNISPTGEMRIFQERFGSGSAGAAAKPSTTAAPSPTVDLWMVLREGYGVPKQFICPSSTDVPDPAHDVTAYYDFETAIHLSYAYHYQHSPVPGIIRPSSEPLFPILADSNPYVKGGVQSALSQDVCAKWRGNSTNHPNREVTNIAYVDGHAVTSKTPCAGLVGPRVPCTTNIQAQAAQDNIYTYSQPGQGVCPGIAKATATQVRSGGRSDACLVP